MLSFLCLLHLLAALHVVLCTDCTSTPTSFPEGTYALFRPDAGCPLNTRFERFTRYWDSEDVGNTNRWRLSEHFDGFIKTDGIQMTFCVKTNAKRGGRYQWPAGDYCIVKKGECPTDFEEGELKWDDEDDNNQNYYKPKDISKHVDGEFTNDTVMFFCCRNDGNASAPVNLPTQRPFYLMRYKGECQQVAGMTVTDEVVVWDTDDKMGDNADYAKGAHPMETGSTNLELSFCYYE